MPQIDISAQPLSPAAASFIAGKTHRILIDGQWMECRSGQTIETRDPATVEVISAIQRCDGGDVDYAVAAARAALAGWSGMTPMARSQLLWAIADMLEANIDELAELETLDQGKALYVGRSAEISGAIAQFRYFARMASLTAIRMLQLMQQAGLPDSVINLVTGYGHEAGAALAAHMDVDKVAFTGSTTTGRAILDASRGNLNG